MEDDDADDEIIGTVKFVVNYVGYNYKLMKDSSWVQELENVNEDSD
jgi:hypothetical protein